MGGSLVVFMFVGIEYEVLFVSCDWLLLIGWFCWCNEFFL